jgi:hypothetical protein
VSGEGKGRRDKRRIILSQGSQASLVSRSHNNVIKVKALERLEVLVETSTTELLYSESPVNCVYWKDNLMVFKSKGIILEDRECCRHILLQSCCANHYR